MFVINVVDPTRRKARLVYEATFMIEPACHSKGEDVLGDGNVDRAVEIVIQPSVLSRADFGGSIAFEEIEPRLVRDIPDRTAHRACAVERPLGALEHFDALKIVEADIGVTTAAVVRIGCADDGLVIVDTDRRGPRRGDAPNNILLVAWS